MTGTHVYLRTHTLKLLAQIKLDGSSYQHLAEVEAFAPVPEPATMIGLAAGALMLVKRRKRESPADI